MSTDKLPQALAATEDDIQLLLAAQCHLGTKNCDKTMEPYVYKRRADGEFLRLGRSVGFGWGLGTVGKDRVGDSDERARAQLGQEGDGYGLGRRYMGADGCGNVIEARTRRISRRNMEAQRAGALGG